MEIKRVGSQASIKGPADWFTGTVRIDPLFLQATDPARATGASVTFEPEAWTAWHTHPLGQTLIVTAGCGRVQRGGGPIEEIRPGDKEKSCETYFICFRFRIDDLHARCLLGPGGKSFCNRR